MVLKDVFKWFNSMNQFCKLIWKTCFILFSSIAIYYKKWTWEYETSKKYLFQHNSLNFFIAGIFCNRKLMKYALKNPFLRKGKCDWFYERNKR